MERPRPGAELVGAIARLVNVKERKGGPEPGKPFGPGPAAALDEALALCRELGFSTSDYDHYVGLADLNYKETGCTSWATWTWWGGLRLGH